MLQYICNNLLQTQKGERKMEKIIDVLNWWDSEHKKRTSISERRKAEGKESLDEMLDKLNEKLDDETREQLKEYLELEEEDWILETDAFYEWGFKTGFRLAMELQE